MRTDFLDRLVARSLGPAESLRPRPAALFEPAQPIGGLPLVGPDEPDDDGVPFSEPEPSPFRRSAAQPRGATPVGSEVAPPRAHSSLPGEPGPPAPRMRKPAATDPAQARSDGGDGPPPLRRRAPAALIPRERRSSVERVSREVVVERRPEPPGRRAPPSLSPAAPGPTVREIVVERIAEVPQPRLATLLPPVAEPPPAPPSRPGPPAPVVIEPRVERSRGRDAPSAAASVASPPAVHVTIGRVEVRAVPAPAEPAERSRPRPKVMSLDEYLEQRSDGGRR